MLAYAGLVLVQKGAAQMEAAAARSAEERSERPAGPTALLRCCLCGEVVSASVQKLQCGLGLCPEEV